MTRTLPPTAASVPTARAFTTEAVRRLGADATTEERACLLVSELATNVVLHARTPMRVSVCRAHGHVRVEVRDDDPHRPAAVTPDLLATSGRGIALVDGLSRSWGVNANERGKTVWFEV